MAVTTAKAIPVSQASIVPRILQFLVFEVVVKDWFLSTQQPFAYWPAVVLTALACLTLAVSPRPEHVPWWIVGGVICAFTLISAGTVWQILSLSGFACAFVCFGGGRRWWPWLLAFLVVAGGAGLRNWSLAVGGIVAVLLALEPRALRYLGLGIAGLVWIVALWPSPPRDLDAWMGMGLSAKPIAGPLRDVMQVELGAFANYSILAGLLAVTAITIRQIWSGRLRHTSYETFAVAGGVGTLTSLALLGRSASSFLTGGSLAGSVSLTVCLVALQAGLGERLVRKPIDLETRRRRRKCLAVLGVFAGATGFVGWGLAAREVSSVLSMAKPAGYTPITEISPDLLRATVAMEDGRFYDHHGFDLASIHRALRTDIREGRVVQGGSTISQQLAKNLFLTDDRTVWRKIQEAFLTFELERRLTKDEIIERYVNRIDYGLGARGIRSAAEQYFHHRTADLTLAESTALVGLVPKPPKDRVDWTFVDIQRQTALERIGFFFPTQYVYGQIQAARAIPTDHLMYPLKDAWDRYATETTTPEWHGVSFYFDLAPDEPNGLDGMYPDLKKHLAAFLEDACSKFGLVAVEHIGVYNDRVQRGTTVALSAHAFGQAIDLSGFRFKDGEHLRVQNHEDPKARTKLLRIEALLKKHFDIVVDWREDPLRHDNHFHAEIRGPRTFPPRAP